MSALGEAVELVSCCAWGDEPLIHASARELGPAALSPTLLNGFSPQQLAERESWNARYGDYDWRPPPYDETRRIDWIEVEDAFGGPKAYAPADFAFIGRKEVGDETAVAIGDSNGCASGATLEEAKTAAILELIERDAAARWWYGRASRPTLNSSVLEAEPNFFRWLSHRSRRSHLVDITNDLDIPVVAAVSAESDGRDVVIGYAASVEIGIAACSAITEMAQIEFALEAVRTSARGPSHWAEWRNRVTLVHPPLGSINTSSSGALEGCRHNRRHFQSFWTACAGADCPYGSATCRGSLFAVLPFERFHRLLRIPSHVSIQEECDSHLTASLKTGSRAP